MFIYIPQARQNARDDVPFAEGYFATTTVDFGIPKFEPTNHTDTGTESSQPDDALSNLVSPQIHRRGGRTFNGERTYHLQRPNPPYPNLQLTLYAFNIVQLHTLPPASSGRLPPEQ